MAAQRIPITKSAGFTFDAMNTVPDHWPAELTAQGLHWTDRRFNLPLACAAGANCQYKCDGKVCMNVHPGEEGTALHYCPARTVEKKVPVKDAYGRVLKWQWQEVTEEACVRYCGNSTFYERRRLRMSWPEWCAHAGLPLPSTVAAKAPVHVAMTEEQQKEAIGTALYPKIRQAFFENLDVMQAENLLTAQTTPGKLAGMLIDGCTMPELQSMLTDTNVLADFLCDGVYLLHETYPAGIHPQLMCY